MLKILTNEDCKSTKGIIAINLVNSYHSSRRAAIFASCITEFAGNEFKVNGF